MTSEELIQKGLSEHGIKINNYEYYELQTTTLNQLQESKIIPGKDYSKYSTRKPDMLLVDRRDKENIKVIVVGEYKRPAEFNTESKRLLAIQQCNDLAQELKAKIGIITDGQTYIWINPNQNDSKNDYEDKTTNKKRSYSFIENEDKKPLSEPFILHEIRNNEPDNDTKNTLYYLDRVLNSINENNSILKPTSEVDPLPLAKSVWQDIYINTGKPETTCLYNVVELFLFKFLSDLNVITPPNDFNSVINLYSTTKEEEVLKYYVYNSRRQIMELFPKGNDGTTIINGSIFIDSNGEPASGQAHLFRTLLEKYKNFGSLKNIKKEFKTKLFETFLKVSKDKSKLGQFLTPRKVVRAIVEMSDVDKLQDGAKFCDPFCGVGGFIAESLHKPNRKSDFEPKNGKISPKIIYRGYDKGMDEDGQLTIVLAKANMLIYLSEVLEKNPTLTKEFAKVLNDIFLLYTDSNLGTLKHIITDENDKYDLILTNPPYITSGVTSIKSEIKKEEGLDNFYTLNGKGVDGLAVEWILKSLKKNGKAFIIVRDGLLNANQNKKLLDFLLKEFYLNCIISLPAKTFFNTPQKTYILGITRKETSRDQDFPVFTYLVSNIGETLDSNRFEIEGKSDLEKAKDLFNLYKGSPNAFEPTDPRCKLQPISTFVEGNWIIDNLWSKEEKINLGIENKENVLSLEEYKSLLENLAKQINKFKNELDALTTTNVNQPVKEESLLTLFIPEKGKSIYTKKYIREHPGKYPVYSSKTTNEGIIGYIDGIPDYDGEYLTWTTDGYAGTVFYRNGKFSMTTHCGALSLKEEYKGKINLKYVAIQLNQILKNMAVGYGNKRVTLTILKKCMIPIPVDENGEYDIRKQNDIAEKYEKLEKIKSELINEISKLNNVSIEF